MGRLSIIIIRPSSDLMDCVHAQWVQNTVMDNHMRARGHPAPELIFIRRGESAVCFFQFQFYERYQIPIYNSLLKVG
jgi:hypothetical protein